MSLIVIDGIRIPTTSEVPGILERALPDPQIVIGRSPQRFDAWCYAACAEMIINYCFQNNFVDQCAVAGFVKETDCCEDLPQQCTESGCRKEQIGEIFFKFNVLDDELKSLISLEDIAQEVTDNPGRLIEVVIDWDAAPDQQSSHAVLLAGIIGDYVFVVDPLPDAHYHGWHTHTELSNGFGGGRWVMTWLGLKGKA